MKEKTTAPMMLCRTSVLTTWPKVGPPEAVVNITAAKEEVRRSKVLSYIKSLSYVTVLTSTTMFS